MRGTVALVGLLLLSLASPPAAAALETLRAEGDVELLALAAAQGWPGTGTSADPIIIEDLGASLFLQHVTLDLHVAGADLALGASRFASGITLLNVSEVTIEDARIVGGGHGIFIHDAKRATILRGEITGARDVAITLWGGLQHPDADLAIEGTRVAASDVAIDLDHVGPGSLAVRDVLLEGNGDGIDATLFSALPTLAIEDNEILDTQGTAILTDARGASIARNVLDGAATGIELRGSRAGARLVGNDIAGAGVAMRIAGRDVAIEGNLLHGNGLGLHLLSAQGATVRQTRFLDNNVGASVGSSRAVLVYDNVFDNFGTNAEELLSDVAWSIAPTPGTNVIGGSIVAGNAWSDNLCFDREGDGVCDGAYLPLRPRFRAPSLTFGTLPLFDLAPLAFER